MDLNRCTLAAFVIEHCPTPTLLELHILIDFGLIIPDV